MSLIPQQYRCDAEGCNNVRGESNHWWLVDPHPQDEFRVGPWDDGCAGEKGCFHACGSECVHKLLSQWMEQQREK